DNGAAFAHRHRGRDKALTCRFSRTVADELGCRVIYSSPYHPQTLGKCERLHQTAAKLLNHFYPEPAATLAELQARLDTVREHYNTRRRHSAVGHPPAQAWHTAPAHGGPGDLPHQTDATVHRLHVVANGTATLGNHILSIGRAHAGETITLLRDGDRVTAYSPDGDPLGALTLHRNRRYQGALTPAA
ncbi:MAG: transposase, partial [Pseudonocardiaceae bacterium]|nr:transposase [Pseudonocardiaceae bacterium]